VRYLVVVWLVCLSVASSLVGWSASNAALVTTLFVSVCVLGAVWGYLVARRGRSRWALFVVPIGAAVLATVLTSIVVLSDQDSGLDSFYPVFLIPVYAIVLGVPVWVGGSVGGVWRFFANRQHRSTDEKRAHPA
jgi:hypothetical protein